MLFYIKGLEAVKHCHACISLLVFVYPLNDGHGGDVDGSVGSCK